MKKAFYIIMAAIAALSFFAPEAYAQKAKQAGIVAHRGFWNCEDAGYAKNSIAALRCAQEAGFWGSETESILLTIFVHPDYQGKGVGRKLIETLERDEYFLRADRIEIPASITAVGFYQKMGYDYKNGISMPDEEQHVRLEKYRK